MNLIIFYTIDGVLYMHESHNLATAREWMREQLANAEKDHTDWQMISVVAERAYA